VFEQVSGEYPEASEELARLVKIYGSDPKSGVAHANSVYGNARAGVRSLKTLIDAAKADDEATAKEAAPIPAPARKRSRVAQAADSLLS
jgi:hypothetical protein